MALRFRHRNGKIFLHNISRSIVRKFAEVQDDFAKEVRPIFDVMYCYVCFFFVFAQIGRTRLHVSRFLCGKHPCLLCLFFCQQGVDWMMTEIGKQRHYENLVMERFWQIHYPMVPLPELVPQTSTDHRPWESQGIWWRYHRRSEIWKPAATRQRGMLEGTHDMSHVSRLIPPVNPLKFWDQKSSADHVWNHSSDSCHSKRSVIKDKHGMPRQRSALPEGA